MIIAIRLKHLQLGRNRILQPAITLTSVTQTAHYSRSNARPPLAAALRFKKNRFHYFIGRMSSLYIFISIVYKLPKKLKCMNQLGFQRTADGASEYESQNRFPVRSNFAQQNCSKNILRCPKMFR